MTRDEALKFVTDNVKNKNLVKHALATEAVMRALYVRLSPVQNPEDLEKWGLVGLLHDADYELCKDHPEKHTLILTEKLKDDLDIEIIYAIKSHNWKNTHVEPKSLMDWSIYCCDELTGLIIAVTLIHPEKKLNFVSVDFVENRFRETSFAKGADRNQIKICQQKLGIPLAEFIQINLKAMQQISPSLGL